MAWNVENIFVQMREMSKSKEELGKVGYSKNMPVLQVPHPKLCSQSQFFTSDMQLRGTTRPQHAVSIWRWNLFERSKSKRSHWVSVYAANLHLIHGTGIGKVEAKHPENCQSKLKIRGEYKLSRRTVPVFAQYQYLSVFFILLFPQISSFVGHGQGHPTWTRADWSPPERPIDSGGESLGARRGFTSAISHGHVDVYLIISLSIQNNG
jgi:hypothetical protein